MNTDCSIALDLLSIAYMIVLFLTMRNRNRVGDKNSYYFVMIITVCIFLTTDIIYQYCYGRSEAGYVVVMKLAKSLYFIINALLVWIWARYVSYIISGDGFKKVYSSSVPFVILIINSTAEFINYFFPFIFDISSKGTLVLSARPMLIFTILNYVSVFHTTFVIIKYRKQLTRSNYLPMLFFLLPPVCGEIIYIFHRGVSITCTYAISVLMIFQVSQNNTIYTDELTGLANRRKLNEYLYKLFRVPNGSMICGIMIDLDHLKYINDTYGHIAGDNAIITMSEIIKSINRSDIVAARYGGDEFVLTWISDNEEDILNVKQRLAERRAYINSTKRENEKVDFSMGEFFCFDYDNYTAEEFLQQIDKKMYQTKKEKRKINAVSC